MWHTSLVPKCTPLRLGRTGARRYGFSTSESAVITARSAVPGGSRVPQAARRQPRRDRDPRLPRRLRARSGDGRGVPVRGPQLPAPREGRRVVPDRRARAPGAGVPVGRRGDRRGAPGGRGCGLPRIRVPVGEPGPRRGVRRCRDHLRGAAATGAAPDRRQGSRDRRRAGGRPAGARVVGAVGGRRRARRGRGRCRVPAVRQGRRRAAAGAGCAASTSPDQLRESALAAMREAQAAFGDSTVFLERAVVNPRHIEVQILADADGNVVHLYERDCSLQRRHQKVIEIAPAPNLDPEIRDRICADAVAFARHIGYVNAGTVEFLLDERGQHVFIEMNPRIQVEHTVTEQVTGRDLVIAQLRIAGGMTLPEMDLRQEQIQLSGAALQCRVTTEDPANGFRPDTGVISAYRSPGGPGVRLDGGTHVAAEVSAHFDSMLVKLTCNSHSFANAVRRARRAVAEFRIRGVATNLPFLAAVLDDPDFRAGPDHHELHRRAPAAARRPPLGRPRHPDPHLPRRDHGEQAERARVRRSSSRSTSCPEGILHAPVVDGSRQLLAALGPEAVRRPAARAGRRGGHRHHLPRRAPVAARHAGAHPGPGRRRPARRPAGARAAQPRVLGRRDLRRRAAVPRRGPVGAARGAARGRAEHLHADAAARAQHRRLHAVPDRGDRRVRRRGRGHRHGHLPDLRRAQRRRADAPRDRRRPGHGDGRRRGRALLHRRPVRPRRAALHPRLLPASGRADRRRRARTSWRSRTWPGCCARPRPGRWSRRCASASTCPSTCTPTTPRAASSPR